MSDNVYPNKAKAIIESHLIAMIEELGSMDHPFGWFGDNADAYLTEVVFNTLMIAKDSQDYCEREEVFVTQ